MKPGRQRRPGFILYLIWQKAVEGLPGQAVYEILDRFGESGFRKTVVILVGICAQQMRFAHPRRDIRLAGRHLHSPLTIRFPVLPAAITSRSVCAFAICMAASCWFKETTSGPYLGPLIVPQSHLRPFSAQSFILWMKQWRGGDVSCPLSQRIKFSIL